MTIITNRDESPHLYQPFLRSPDIFYIYLIISLNGKILNKINTRKRYYWCFCLIALSAFAFSQKNFSEVDLQEQLSKANSDSARVDMMVTFATRSGNHSTSKSVDYALRAIELAKKSNYINGLMSAYEAAGDAYWYNYNFEKSVENYLKELKIADSLHIPFRIAKANYNIGWIKCVQQGIFSERKKLINALHVFEKLRDTASIIEVCNALAPVYSNRYDATGHYLDSANFYFRGMIYMAEHSTFKNNMLSIYGNYSIFLIDHKKYAEAKKYLFKALSSSNSLKDTFNYVSNSNILALLYVQTDSLNKAEQIVNKILPVIKRKDYKNNLVDAYRILYMVYEKKKDYKKALDFHVLFKDISDTLNMAIFRSNLQEKETAFEIQKREENIKKLEQMNEMAELKNRQNNYVMLGMAGGGILVIAFAFNLYRGNKNKQRANQQLSEQNRVIADKKLEIEQSIQYAKGIQNAILPAPGEMKSILPASFILYLPKDVVSGDFYWNYLCPVITGSDSPENTIPGNQKILLAAADCTGHGVPGSLMSIVSIDKLNHAVLSKKLTSPSSILKSINNDIKNALKQQSATNKQKDGLDIALLLIDTTNLNLTYAGAHRPLWIIRNGELVEYKATKTSIAGHTPYDYPFEESIINLKKDDLIVISSDGFADQFGGKDGKKMMTRNFKNYLISLANREIPEIESGLLNYFLSWKGQHEQVDDVLVIGIKI